MKINNMCISQIEKKDNPSKRVGNICIILKNSKRDPHKKRKKKKVSNIFWGLSLSNLTRPYNSAPLFKKFSMPEINVQKYKKLSIRNSDVAVNSHKPYRSNYIVNVASGYPTSECLNSFNNSITKTKWEIYRCQLNTKEETCCCSCNSDAMFEVMKSLYDCYKKKNCDHCNCILCAHLPREERRLGEMRKSVDGIDIETISSKEKKKRKMKKSETRLPVESKFAIETEKSKKVEAADHFVPLEWKKPAEREKQLRKQTDVDVVLPAKQTPSEKKYKTQKVKTETAVKKSPSEKIHKTKETGLLTPLQGKTNEQKEKTLKELAMRGLPLPRAKTPSEKKLLHKVRTDLGLPQEPKTASEKDKYNKGLIAGIVMPLEGRTPLEKEEILKAQAKLGIPLPQGRTFSEKALIKKIKALKRKPKTREKRAMSPIKIKKLDEKTAKIMKEGKGPSDECICDIFITESENLIQKPKLSKLIPHKITSEKLKSAKAAGLLTPLANKTSAQRENILKELAKHGLPLPEGKSASEKRIIDKVRLDMGLPPEPKTPSAKEHYAKAQAAGIILPLEGKTASQKEKLLTEQAKMGIPLPIGRTPSEKALINKVKSTILRRISSEKLRKAKSAGLLTTLQGKSPMQKEKILRGRVAAGLPLPKGKTPSEKELIKKVRVATGYESPVGNIRSAATISSIKRVESKTPSQKEKILRSLAKQGLQRPKIAKSSEKSLISKIKTTHKTQSTAHTPSEALRKVKAAGILTPLEGKTTPEKEKILKRMHKAGIPLPEGKTPSDKELIKKVKRDLSLAQKSKSLSDKIRKAYAAGLVTPLEGKTPAQKEKILKKLAKAGAPLPEGRTSSEKFLIKRIKAEAMAKPSKGQIPSRLGPPALSPKKRQKLDKKTTKLMKEGEGPSDECLCTLLTPESERALKISLPSVSSEKLRKDKTAELSTRLAGKTPAQKEKIIKDLAMKGLPVPEGKTTSEKKLIDKVRKDLGLPPEPKTSSERKKYNKALATGAIVPLEGKTSTQKNKILRNQAKLGIPLPKGRTRSEKALIDSIKARLSPKRISSEKISKRKMKSKEIGVASAKRSTKSIGGFKKSAGIVEELQDVLKTTTCDRGCGCDKKKIRFKHSYVKIRVTSPDISSLCPCPYECIPGVKNGVLTDSEGIKVTVGRVVGVPSFSIETPKNSRPTFIYINDNFATTSIDSLVNDFIYSSLDDPNINSSELIKNVSHSPIDANLSKEYQGGKYSNYCRIYNKEYPYVCEFKTDNSLTETDYTNCDSSSHIIKRTPSILISIISKDCSELSGSSFKSIYIIETESSLTSTQTKHSIGETTVLSLFENSIASHYKHYLCYSQSETSYSDESDEENVKDYSISENEISNKFGIQGNSIQNKGNGEGFTKNTDVLIFRVSGMSKINFNENFRRNIHTDRPVLIVNDLNSEHDINAMVDEIISNKLIEDISSVFIIVASNENASECSGYSSSVYIQMSENVYNWKNDVHINDKSDRTLKNVRYVNGFKMNTKGKTIYLEQAKEKSTTVSEVELQKHIKKVINRRDKFQNKRNNGDKYGRHVASMDTTCDRPCCCRFQPKIMIPKSYTSSDQRVASVVSEFVTPMIMKQGIAQGLNDKELNIPELGGGKQSLCDEIQMEVTPVKPCIIPPCTGRNSCHDIVEPSRKNVTSTSPNNRSGTSHPYHCTQTNNTELTYGTGGTGARNVSTLEPRVPDNNSCATCDRPNFIDGKKKSCLCSRKEKKVRLEQKCPCQIYDKSSSPEQDKDTISVGCQHDSKYTRQGIPVSKDICICKKKKKKTILCECPEFLELNEQSVLESPLLIDEKFIRKMQSDLTQTTSGFKLHTQKRLPLEEGVNYEDIMNYYKKFLEDEGDTLIDRQDCDCEGPRKNPKDVECECPYEPLPTAPVSEIPPKGLKIHIGGKGSGTKGLSGICCFDMLLENKRVVKFKSINHLS